MMTQSFLLMYGLEHLDICIQMQSLALMQVVRGCVNFSFSSFVSILFVLLHFGTFFASFAICSILVTVGGSSSFWKQNSLGPSRHTGQRNVLRSTR